MTEIKTDIFTFAEENSSGLVKVSLSVSLTNNGEENSKESPIANDLL